MAAQIQKLQLAYPNWDGNELYREEIAQMVKDFGEVATERAITRAVREIPDYCPSIAGLRNLCAVEKEKNMGGMLVCSICAPTAGWLYHVKPSTGNDYVSRCKHGGNQTYEIQHDYEEERLYFPERFATDEDYGRIHAKLKLIATGAFRKVKV